MRFNLFLLAICISITAFSQAIVVAAPKTNSAGITAFNTKDNNCESAFENLQLFSDSIFFIIDEIKCRQFEFFVILYNSHIYFARNTQFNGISQIREKLSSLKSVFSDFNERLNFTKERIGSYVDSISALMIKRKLVLDSIEKVKADSVFLKKNRDHDSLTKIMRDIVDKAGPRKTIIKSWNFFTNDYLDNYIDIHIEVLNPYKKRIKYIKFTFHAFNPVGDPAKDLRSNSHIKTVEGVGPINPLETAEYYFKTVYNTPVLSTLKLKTVTVVFFDSTSAVISDPIEMSME